MPQAEHGKPRRPGSPAWIVLVLAVLISAVACSSSSSNASPAEGGASAPGGNKFTVGISWASLANPAAIGELNQVTKAAKKAGVKLLPPVNANNDVSKQISDIRNLIAEGAQGLIVFVVNPEAIAPALSYAETKKIPVVTQDVLPLAGHDYMDVGSNNISMGEQECMEIGKQTGGTGQVLLVLGSLKDASGRDRAAGVTNCLKKNYPHITRVTTPSTNWLPTLAAQYVQTLIPAHPDLKAIGLASDGVQLPAVTGVLKQLKKWIPAGKPGHLFLDSIDGTPLALQDIRAGYLDSVVVQPYNLYAADSVQALLAALHGKRYHTGSTAGFNGTPITTFAGNLWMQPPAPLVTKANASDPALWGNQG